MNKIINFISILIVGISIISFFISILYLIFDKKNRKKALQTLLASVILFIIGFSACVSTFDLDVR
ncbi:hypothetical protein IA01_04955 [Flavobacterium psychrophilum]|uniref:Uncharacterized protein n=1 Tax=Flavobacterium psychrophilum (strain ATCC 49511 / DSM 21280 / CIP 103535 / JIP02/86) TaxID=402612 RepID=A6GYG7_FLAPJ|nr:hypothetical protein IA03_04940 [Flavobacterium psychrophilum]AIN72846.1 hypothetical protein FPG101_07135 [Flavobacterium psychrophilum FPG101]AIN75227.1 hypothetical protein FPG3_10980 [Flavobacterium psychrophilum FPG3]OXB13762.1 hypothetical protein B0A57_03715 [Flavobacterium psychrophilum DSM 3660 = ATCC 49418]ROO21556.1 hypothetical protein FPG104_03575 [Flavobacterium psychrophilum 10]CAL43140.1 Hypothetical protein FP1046 [Flavobacterium psychrophilum JIP02/86]